MANLSNINNKFLFTDGDFLLINGATANSISATESGIAIKNSNAATLSLQNSAANGKNHTLWSNTDGSFNITDIGVATRFTIASGGNVGIGTSSPDGNLEVIASTTVSGASDSVNNVLIGLQAANRPTVILDTADTTYTNRTWNITNVGSAGSLFFGRNGLDVLVMKNDGNVGIGTDSPTGFRLVVENTTEDLLNLHNSTDGLDSLISFTNPGGTLARIQGIDNGGLGFDVGNNAGGIISNAMFVKSNGNVGIGTTSPAQKLDVNGNIAIRDTYKIFFNHNTNTARYIGASSADDLDIASNDDINYRSNYNRFFDGSTEFARLSGSTNSWIANGSNGKLGIGTTSPGYTFTVNKSITNDWLALFGNTYNGAGNGVLIDAGNGSSGEILRLRDKDGNNKVHFLSNGSVGIGTTSPGYKLDVYGTSGDTLTARFKAQGASTDAIVDIESERDCYLRFRPANTNKWTIVADYPATGDLDIYNYPNNFDSITFKDNRNIITNMSGGNFGIGTTSPAGKLHIIDTSNPNATSGSVIIEGRRDGGANVLTLRAKDASAPSSALPAAQGAVLRWQGFDGTDFENMGYIYVAADGQAVANADAPSYMSFGTSGDGSSTPSERMRITSGGYFKASNSGTIPTSNAHELVSNYNGGQIAQFTHSGSIPYGMQIKYSNASPNTTDNYFFLGTDSTANRIIVWGNGNVQNQNNSYGAISDIKLKENIVDATPKLDDLMKVKVRNYNLIGNDQKQIGVVAQELEEVFPAMIDESIDYEDKEIIDKEGNISTEKVDLGTTTKSVKYSVFIPMLIKSIQELKADNDSLKARIETLENK